MPAISGELKRFLRDDGPIKISRSIQDHQKKIREFREKLSAGDKIITAGGIYGKIKDVKETSFLVEISDNVKIRIDKNSVYPSAEDAQTDPANAEKKA